MSALIRKMLNEKKYLDAFAFKEEFLAFFNFAGSLIPILDPEDKPIDLFLKKPDLLHEDKYNFITIHEKNFEKYKEELKQKEKFLKIFKPNIQSLKPHKKM